MAASKSPLKPYANALLLVKGQQETQQINGRWSYKTGNGYLVRCFLKRQQYTGVSSGSRMIPIPSQLGGEMLPGASGDSFYYRGFSLEYAVVSSNYNLETDNLDGLTFNIINEQPYWLVAGNRCEFKLGDDPIMREARIERSSGQFGGEGIDKILYREIGGVELQLTGGQIQD